MSAAVPLQTMEVETPDLIAYASWWRRVVAFALDVGLMSVAPLLVAFVSFYRAADHAETDLYGALDEMVGGIILATVLGIVSSMLYFTLLIGRSGQTLGMRVVGIAVRDAREATRRIGYGRALARWLVIVVLWALYYVPGIIDGLWPLWDKRRQSWHDKVVRSIVVRLSDEPTRAELVDYLGERSSGEPPVEEL